AQICHCLQLTDLTFTSNNLIQLPESIGSLVNLKILRVDENEIKTLSSAIGSLSSLEELVFNENEVESLPTNIGLLRNLQTLIGDCNRLTELPVSIGSCVNLRILSLAENQLKVIPDELGRLSSLKVLNLNSNFLTYLPLSLTKITNLQALWLNENQTKPLIQLQSDIDRESGQKVLTCFLLPQMSDQSRNSPKSVVSPNDSNNTNNNVLPERQMIKFSNDSSALNSIDDDLDVRITTKLIRAPTPYPKELKAHARHARNLALKQRDANGTNGDNEMVTLVNGCEPTAASEGDRQSSHSEVKETKVSKSPLNSRHIPTNIDPPKRPTTLPVNSLFNFPNINTSAKSALEMDRLELVASKISQLIVSESKATDESTAKSGHERKASYKVAVNSSLSLKSPIERKIKLKSIASKEDDERGYKSDVEFYSTQSLLNNTITGYSSDCELRSKRLDRLKEVVPKECDLDSSLIKTPLESDSESDCGSHPNIQLTDIKSTDCSDVNAMDFNSNSSIGSLYPSTGSERPVSVCSGHSPFSGAGSTASDNTSAKTSQCSLSRTEHKATEAANQTPSLPPKPLNYTPSPLDLGLTAPVVGNTRQRQPQTASSQFIIHKFSHDSYTQSKPSIGHNSSPPTGVFVSCVEPAGSASTALKVGDKILQIDGIDLLNVTKDKAIHIFESTGDTISLMVSRDKS
ncbi:unnamed protein product, partial [Medioppia subpectinata]